jgi:phosphate transport system protein
MTKRVTVSARKNTMSVRSSLLQGEPLERHFAIELKELKGQILSMAGYVEQSTDRAIQALSERSLARLADVRPLEAKINQAHIDIDNVCLGILARQAPVAADLRLILAVVKINTDLERMGDQAVNLSRNTEHYLQHPALDLAREIPQMSKLVQTMVRESLDAFVNGDSELAKVVLLSDDAVDEFKNRLFKLLKERMKSDPNSIEASINLILMARNLERIADHATNIAEDVIFVSTGQDVRHGGGSRG